MAKEKKSGLTNKHLHARIAYLHRAASHLATQNSSCSAQSRGSHTASSSTEPPSRGGDGQTPDSDMNEASSDQSKSDDLKSAGGLPLYLTYHFRQVAQKAQIRLESSVKHSFCKTCNNVLVEGSTSKKYVENLSRQGVTPHADVMVLECCLCGTKQRFPIGAKRQAKKSRRTSLKMTEAGKAELEVPREMG